MTTCSSAPLTDAGTRLHKRNRLTHAPEVKRRREKSVKSCKIDMYNCIDYVAIISTFILVINKYIVAYNV